MCICVMMMIMIIIIIIIGCLLYLIVIGLSFIITFNSSAKYQLPVQECLLEPVSPSGAQISF